MRKSKKKIIPAKRDAILSLQFYRDKEGTPNFLVTSNPESDNDRVNLFTGVDELIFARNLALDNSMSIKELTFLCSFFERVRYELQLIVGLDKEKKA